MKKDKLLLFYLCFGISIAYSQNISSINSGANSTNNLIYSVGEIFVLPLEPNDASSGTIGALSRVEFFVTGLNELSILENVNAYPNPASNSIIIETPSETFNSVFVYDLNGKLLGNKIVTNKQIDLSDLSIGIYLIKTDNSKIQPFKIIKN